MLTLSIPTYDINMIKIEGYQGCHRPFSEFDLERQLSDLEVKNFKFCSIIILHMVAESTPMLF